MGHQLSTPPVGVPGQRPPWPKSRTLASWVWTLASLLSFGLANSGLFFYAALKCRRLLDWLAEGGYLTSLVVFVIASQRDRDDAFDTTAAALFFTTWIVGAGHAFTVRRSVFTPTEGDPPALTPYGTGAYGTGTYGTGSGERLAGPTIDPAITRALGARERRAQARQILAEDPRLASDLGVGRPDLGRGYDDGGLVDVNTAPESLLASRLELDEVTTERIATARAAISGFISAEEIAVLADISSGTLDRIGDRIVFSPRE